FASQIAEKRPERRQLARGCRARLAPLVRIGEKTANGRAIELVGREGTHLHARRERGMREKLRQVAVVRADRVRRHVSVQPEESQKLLELGRHGWSAPRAEPTAARPLANPWRAIHASRSASARSASASLRRILSRGGLASGGMMPNVMFDGS